MKVNKIAELKKTIGKMISGSLDSGEPKTITFNRGIEFPQYKITIEVIEDDFFIDAKGVRWQRMG